MEPNPTKIHRLPQNPQQNSNPIEPSHYGTNPISEHSPKGLTLHPSHRSHNPATIIP
ncbi:hypothetical protein HDF12_001302 [Edaphobacter lichenicola]|uniref:Uncharacterized protein n=1 Tax=Tunturiibacter lichenicola TaxID=2051959 RepID=A0A7Y9T2A0_9BACT|nr:hypothetical protein [Edaphobacter lichenicola]